MLNWSEILLRLLLACLFGAMIGLERERKDWAAGIRTHMMVCLGSCLIMIVSSFGFSDVLGRDKVVLDPSRVAAQVISGIGFLGAGAILFSKQGTIRGLTTAAGLWTVAAIGLATGGGLYFPAATTTLLALGILWALQPLERIYSRRFKHKALRIVTSPEADPSILLKDLTQDDQLKIQSLIMDKNDHEIVLQLRFENPNFNRLNSIITLLKNMPAVREVVWIQ